MDGRERQAARSARRGGREGEGRQPRRGGARARQGARARAGARGGGGGGEAVCGGRPPQQDGSAAGGAREGARAREAARGSVRRAARPHAASHLWLRPPLSSPAAVRRAGAPAASDATPLPSATRLRLRTVQVQGKCRALSERCGRLEREKRDALRELALEQAAGLQAQREAEAREVELARLGGSSLAGQHAAASLPELVAQHNAAAAKMQAAARRRFSQGAEERPAAVSAQLAKQPAAGADAAQATPGQAGAGVAQQPSQGQARAEGSASTQSGMPARNQAAQPSDSTLAPKGGGATTVSSDEEMGPAPSAKPVPSPQKGGGFMSGLFGSTPP